MFPELKNDRFLRALKREAVDVTPVWMMRQAGRYLPEYRATRSQAGDFMSVCQNKQLACEVTLQPLERFDFDAAILFSDILTIPDAMGLGLHFVTGEGPKFHKPIHTPDDLKLIKDIKAKDDLSYVMDAVSLIRQELNGRVPLIGFSGSPWTLACYMIEGQSTREFKKIKQWVFDYPQALHELLNALAMSVADYLSEQIKAGAQAVQIFDTWGGVLTHNAYHEFSLAYMQQIIAHLKASEETKDTPVILFTKQGGLWLESMVETGTSALGLDWSINIGDAKKRVGNKVALQGNMDPATLRAQPEKIRAEVAHILESFGQGEGHVFNLGHGITPDINPEHVKVFVDAVHECSAKYHQA